MSGRVFSTCTLLFIATMANYLGNLRPNYFAGIRTPWTLEDPETWRATHRVGARAMFFGALALMVLQFFLRPAFFVLLLSASILSLVVWAFFYSWRHFHAHLAGN